LITSVIEGTKRTGIKPSPFSFSERTLRGFRPLILISIALLASNCAPDPVATALWVEIPSIVIICQDGNCRQNVTPKIYAQLTTSGCSAPTAGLQRTVELTSIICSSGSGCVGTLQPWLYQGSRSTTGIPAGTYSICVRIDYNQDYPSSTTGDTLGVVNGYKISSTTSASGSYFMYSTWTDQ
jgi:hypothetical protein